MKLARVTAAGFRGISGILSIDLVGTTTVISGANGSGKTTIADAVEFALTGRLARFEPRTEKGETIEQYLWWRGPLPATVRYVELVFVDDEHQAVTVRRNPTGPAVWTPPDGEHRVFSGGPQGSIERFCRSSIIRDEGIAMSLDMAETERAGLVRSVLGAPQTAGLDDRAKIMTSLLNKLLRALDTEYENARSRVTDFLARLSALRTSTEAIPDAAQAASMLRSLVGGDDVPVASLVSQARQRVLSLRQESESLRQVALTARVARKALQDVDSAEYRKRLSEATSKRSACRAEVEELRNAMTALEAQMKATQDVHRDVSRLAELSSLGEAIGLIGGRCPLCASQLTPRELSDRIKSIQDSLGVVGDGLRTLQGQREAVAANLLAAQQRQEQAEKVESELRAGPEGARAHFQGALSDAKKILGSETSDDAPAVEGQLDPRADQVDEQALKIEMHVKVLESSILLESSAELQQKLSFAREEVERTENRRSALRTVQDDVERTTDTAKRAIGEYVDDRLAAMGPLLKEMYSRLRPHAGFLELDYLSRGELRRFLSFRVGDGLNPAFMFSAGQRRAAGLAFLLAFYLSRPQGGLRTLILDDPVSHVDDFRALHLVETLAAICRQGHQVVCMVEDGALADLIIRRVDRKEAATAQHVVLESVPSSGVRLKVSTPTSPFPQGVLVPV